MSAAPYELVIGIETHVELKTDSKMFCGCQARWFGAPPNTLVCPVCLGLPGALPVPNRRAIELAITAGLALHCETPEHTKFDRKNYLYPDLPKGYQISQYDLPLSVKGWLDLPTGKRIRITRAHLEEDTGTLKHGEDAGRRYTLVDFNRSGVPLLEIVSEPDMSSADEGEAYVRALRDILIFSGVSEVRLEQGAGRFDVNVSIRFQEDGKTRWPPQSEIKNLNSYQALREAVAFESDRLWQEWQSGGEIRTRTGKITVGWSPERGRTYLQRSKEDVEDYRYFPEPDQPKAIANWVIGDLTAALKRDGVEIGASRVGPDQLAALVRLIAAGTVTVSAAKQVFTEMWKNAGDPLAIVNTLGLAQVSDEDAIKAAVDEVIKASPKVVEDYKRGNARALGALVGPVMKRLGNKANAAVVNRMLAERLA